MSRKLIIEHPLREDVVDLENINFLDRASKKVTIQETEAHKEAETKSTPNVNSY